LFQGKKKGSAGRAKGPGRDLKKRQAGRTDQGSIKGEKRGKGGERAPKREEKGGGKRLDEASGDKNSRGGERKRGTPMPRSGKKRLIGGLRRVYDLGEKKKGECCQIKRPPEGKTSRIFMVEEPPLDEKRPL